MRHFIALIGLVALAAAPATKPTTRPAPKQRFSLMDGAVKYMVPAGWTESNRNDAEHVVQYNSPDGKASIVVGVVPQQYAIPANDPHFTEMMKTSVINSMKAKFKKNNDTVTYGPRSETDDRFLLRIHDRITRGDQNLDEVQLYRAAGLDLLMVLTSVKADDPKEARPFHEQGEDTCLSIILGAADKHKTTKEPSH